MKPWLRLTLVFLAGLFFGIAVGRWTSFSGYHLPHEKRTEALLRRFSRELDLTSEQREKVRAVIERKSQKMQEAKAEVRPRMEKIRKEAREEIAALLTAKQVVKFEELEKEFERRRRRRHGHPRSK